MWIILPLHTCGTRLNRAPSQGVDVGASRLARRTGPKELVISDMA